MTAQLTMFGERLPADVCAARHGSQPCSVAANPGPVSKAADRAVILQLAQQRGAFGLTLDEACAVLDRSPNQLSGRFTELHRTLHQLTDSGQKRPTRSGKPATVYVAVE